MKTILLGYLPILSIFILFAGCQSTSNYYDSEGLTKIVVGATVLPHADLLSVVKEDLLNENIKLQIKEFSDYTLLNKALVDGDIDANFFQHVPFLEWYMDSTGNKLISLGEVHIEPMGAYSYRIPNIDYLSSGSVVAIPLDPSNESRALLLLEDHGLIKLDSNSTTDISTYNIVENPLNLEFTPIEASQMTRILPDVDLAVINTNNALLVDLVPREDALIIESVESPFANVVVVREGEETRPELQALMNALQSDVMRDYIEETYQGNIIPAF